MVPSRARDAARIVAIGVLYFAAAKIGFRAAFVADQVSPVWPPTGLALWAVLWMGPRVWPALWIAAFAANVTTQVPLVAAAGIATGNTLEALVGASLLRRSVGVDRTLEGLLHVTGLIGASALVSTTISATIGVAMLCVSGLQAWTSFGQLWWIWWLGDATGALIVAPVLLTAPLWRRRRTYSGGLVEAAVLEAVAVVISLLVFVMPLAPLTGRHPLEFAVFPVVVWAGLRFAHPGAALINGTVSLVAIWGTLRGAGPFGGAPATPHENVILLQIFTAVIATSGLVLGAAIADRNRSERLRAADHRLAAILSEEADLEAAASRILNAVCDTLEWDVGILWRTNDHRRMLDFVDSWSRDPRVADFIADSRARNFIPGVGLPGRVWASAQPIGIADVTVDSNFPRAPVARRAGLHGGFAFPIRLGRNVLGVMEFFSLESRAVDASLLAQMTAAGSQIGQFIERANLLARERLARLQAEEASRSKDQFLATVSHELRTPLTAILGWASMLQTREFPPERARYIFEAVYRNAQAQAQIVDDLLDVSRIVAGQLRIDVQPIDLCEVARLGLETIRPTAIAKSVALESNIPASRVVVSGDPARLQQVVWNLLSNATKFTPAGGKIALTVRSTPSHALIEVKDTGIGIQTASLPHVFERFWQADSTTTRAHGGLGLGLALVRHIVELHGGEVHATSAGEGRGSVFTVKIPCDYADGRELSRETSRTSSAT